MSVINSSAVIRVLILNGGGSYPIDFKNFIKGPYLDWLPLELVDIIFKQGELSLMKNPTPNIRSFYECMTHNNYTSNLNYKTSKSNFNEWRDPDYYRSINYENSSSKMTQTFQTNRKLKWISHRIELEDKCEDVMEVYINNNLDCIFKCLRSWIETYIYPPYYNELYFTEILENIDLKTFQLLIFVFFAIDPPPSFEFFKNGDLRPQPGLEILKNVPDANIDEGLTRIGIILTQSKDITNTFSLIDGYQDTNIVLGEPLRVIIQGTATNTD